MAAVFPYPCELMSWQWTTRRAMSQRKLIDQSFYFIERVPVGLGPQQTMPGRVLVSSRSRVCHEQEDSTIVTGV